MSRIGKLPIPLPASVTIEQQGNHLTAKGPKGTLERALPAQIAIRVEDGRILVERPTESREHRALHGLTRTLVSNMVVGVSDGFRKDLDLVGVGYRVAMQGSELVLNLGFSHPVKFAPPPGISVEVTDPTHFSILGSSKEAVGQVAADLRKLRPPEPYKGKGMMYRGEKIRRKAGKAGKGAK